MVAEASASRRVRTQEKRRASTSGHQKYWPLNSIHATNRRPRDDTMDACSIPTPPRAQEEHPRSWRLSWANRQKRPTVPHLPPLCVGPTQVPPRVAPASGTVPVHDRCAHKKLCRTGPRPLEKAPCISTGPRGLRAPGPRHASAPAFAAGPRMAHPLDGRWGMYISALPHGALEGHGLSGEALRI